MEYCRDASPPRGEEAPATLNHLGLHNGCKASCPRAGWLGELEVATMITPLERVQAWRSQRLGTRPLLSWRRLRPRPYTQSDGATPRCQHVDGVQKARVRSVLLDAEAPDPVLTRRVVRNGAAGGVMAA